jgi:hypothetical protein
MAEARRRNDCIYVEKERKVKFKNGSQVPSMGNFAHSNGAYQYDYNRNRILVCRVTSPFTCHLAFILCACIPSCGIVLKRTPVLMD